MKQERIKKIEILIICKQKNMKLPFLAVSPSDFYENIKQIGFNSENIKNLGYKNHDIC